jgi:hypothetical protein
VSYSGFATQRLAPGGIVRRNPCPACGKLPQDLAGRVLFEIYDAMSDERFLVCWPCDMLRPQDRQVPPALRQEHHRHIKRGAEWIAGKAFREALASERKSPST